MKRKTLVFASVLSAFILPAQAETIGVWCDTMIPQMPKMDAVMVIETLPNGRYHLRTEYGDGSKARSNLTKSGTIFSTGNEFGEHYKIESNGGLGLYDADGFIRLAKRAGMDAKAGKCR